MVNYTRLDCALGSAALMRQALAQAIHHAGHRIAFGRRLVEHALMKNVLADLALESEAATALVLRLACAYDSDDEEERALRRLITPAAKFWICKRVAAFAQEAMEVLGGNGYVEESVLARIYREAPLNSIWEGSGNVMCLDLLRALGQEQDAVSILRSAVASAQGRDPRLDKFLAQLYEELPAAPADEAGARRLAGRLILALQSALLIEHAPAPVAEAFCASRLDGASGRVYGMLDTARACDSIIERAAPVR
jgi:putative acyl-CoA dehydrogenase